MDLSKGFRHSESQNDLGLVMLYKSSASFTTLVLETLRRVISDISTCNSARIVLGCYEVPRYQ